MNGGTCRTGEALSRLRRLYVAAAVLTLNSWLLFVGLNLLLALVFWLADAGGVTTPGPQDRGAARALAVFRLARLVAAHTGDTGDASPLALGDRELDAIYPGRSRREVARLVAETRGRRLGYQPFSQFGELPYAGRFVRVSEHGFRESRHQGPWPMSPAAFNVWVLGGSTTFGYGVADGETIPSFLQQYLAQELAGRTVAVYNFGQAYYYSSQELALLYRLLLASEVRPAFVVFIDGINEHFKEPYYTQALTDRVAAPLATQSFRPEAVTLDDGDEVVSRYLANRRLLEAWCAELGIRPLFVWQPNPAWKYDLRFHPFLDGGRGAAGAGEPVYGMSFPYAAMEKRLEATRLGADTRFLSLADLQMGHEKALYVDRIHYTADFSREIATHIGRRIVAIAGLGS